MRTFIVLLVLAVASFAQAFDGFYVNDRTTWAVTGDDWALYLGMPGGPWVQASQGKVLPNYPGSVILSYTHRNAPFVLYSQDGEWLIWTASGSVVPVEYYPFIGWEIGTPTWCIK